MAASAESTDGAPDGSLSDDEVTALSGMLAGYSKEQLVEEVLNAWRDLDVANTKSAENAQRVRLLELDLQERVEQGAPEKAMLDRAEEDRKNLETKVIHLERLLDDSRSEHENLKGSLTQQRMIQLEEDRDQLQVITEEQKQVIGDMEGQLDELVEAVKNAAEAGLTSMSAEQVRFLEAGLSDANERISVLEEEQRAVLSERDRLRDITERLRKLVEMRDERIIELEGVIEEIRHGPKSVSAEHDYLVEQIEELKRRLLERNREYESMRRRERKLHKDVFERDERIAQLQLTVADIEAALSDRMAEMAALEKRHDEAIDELKRLKEDARTKDVVNKAFVDSLIVRRSAENNPPKEEGWTASKMPTHEPGGSAAPADLDEADEMDDQSDED